MADDFEQIEDMYAAADRILGRIPKVTPSSKVVGDLALALVAAKADPADFAENPQNYDIPDSVVGFMAGELGDLPGGWPEPFRTNVLAGRQISIEVPPLTAAEHDGLAGDAASRLEDSRPVARLFKTFKTLDGLDEPPVAQTHAATGFGDVLQALRRGPSKQLAGGRLLAQSAAGKLGRSVASLPAEHTTTHPAARTALSSGYSSPSMVASSGVSW